MATSQQKLHFLTIGQASKLIRHRKLSPVELTRAFLERIDEVDGRLRSYVTTLSETALEQASIAEAEVMRGEWRSPLHGIPIALKDLYDTKGVRTTGQSKVFEHRVPEEDATIVSRLREAGAILLGKLAMHELALGGPETSLFDQARNPWNLAYITGGSSSGSGAAVAAGLCMASLGSDTGGSIRGPASLCGIVGLKPSYGLVSRHGVMPLSWSLDHCGPMTWTVEDTALMLEVIAGYDPKDPASRSVRVPKYSSSLKKGVGDVTIGIPRHYFFDKSSGVGAETISAVEKALSSLEQLGARLEEVRIPSLEYAGVANHVIMLSEAFAYHRAELQSQPRSFGNIIRRDLYLGGLISAADYVHAQRVRSRVKKEIAEAFGSVDVLAMPSRQGPAVKLEDYDPYSLFMVPSFSGPFNQAGVPAISIPCGFSESGLPIGLQIAGKAFDEPTVLRVAYAYEQYARWIDTRPAL